MRDVKAPEVRRREIIDASMKLFMEKGYQKTRTQDIIERVGISRGLLYYHFKNKEDILYSLIELYTEPLARSLSTIANANDLSPAQKVKAFFDATVIDPAGKTAEKETLQETVDMKANHYLMDRFSHKLVEQTSKDLTKIFEEGLAKGDFHIENPKELAQMLMTAYVFTDKSLQTQDYIRTFHELINKALGENIF
ncbi:TetR/AcrR family transcriptional regulator [Streptococcus sobrinus]|uniref:TetR/AcrR family transcriptional regulator n=1 Tax=Streptococcus sobrinus TaxID=1310 RepID=UPI0002EC18DC|nr:TetR/AcrR family transcriptional regulator [Streptococcus sobrinus]